MSWYYLKWKTGVIVPIYGSVLCMDMDWEFVLVFPDFDVCVTYHISILWAHHKHICVTSYNSQVPMAKVYTRPAEVAV